MADQPDTQSEALRLARLGLAVFPCHGVVLWKCTCGKSGCPVGKHPWTNNGVKDAATDAQKIKKWSKKWKDGANIAIAGGNGLLIVDVDSYKPAADANLAELEREHGALPRDWTVASGGGGTHIYLRLPDGIQVSSKKDWRDDIDLRSNGGYVIAPPSTHESGKPYIWISQLGDAPPLVPSKWIKILPVIEQASSVKPPVSKKKSPARDKSERRTEIQSRQINPSSSVYASGYRWSEEANKFILNAIELTAVTECDTHNDRRLSFARRLKSNDELRGLDGEDLEQPYRQWFERSRPFVAEEHQDWDNSFSQWLSVWDWTQIDQTQEAVYIAYSKSLNRPIPAPATKYQSRTKRQLLALCHVLATDHADAKGVWYLSSRKAAEVFGGSKDVLCDWLNDFCRDGLMVKICELCGAAGTIRTTKVDGNARRECTSCKADLTGRRKAQRFRYIAEAATESIAA